MIKWLDGLTLLTPTRYDTLIIVPSETKGNLSKHQDIYTFKISEVLKISPVVGSLT